MKISLCENDGCFAFNMQAENMVDAALLVRFATNRIDEIRSATTHVHGSGDFLGHCVIGKRKNAGVAVARAR